MAIRQDTLQNPSQDTIVAISTAPGRGGIGVVRLSGPRAREIAAPLLRLRHQLAPGRARFGEILDLTNRTPNPSDPTSNLEPRTSNPALDECVATYFAAPHSYTSEDVVEIAMHGSPVLLEYVVRECCAAEGARLADPGEFTQRAFLAGRIDLTQAEAVDDLIGSSTLQQARVAAQQLGGALAKLVAPMKDELVGLIAAMEAGIDFAEDDIDVLPAAAILTKIAAVRLPLAELERSFAYGRVVRDGFKLAIVGRPNAGKSSLFNRLVERDRAIVTATPGTTRDLVTERVAIDGIPVDLIDTAGLREASDEAERMGIAKSHEAMADADVVLLVIDATEGIFPQDRDVLGAGDNVLVAWNKSDLAPEVRGDANVGAGPAEEQIPFGNDKRAHDNEAHAKPVDDKPVRDKRAHDTRADNDHSDGTQTTVVRTSALTGEGIAELRAAIVQAVAGNNGGLRESGMLTNLRQHQAVQQALHGLDAASSAAENAIPHEMIMLDLYESLRGLDALTGATTTDDVLHLIFSKFCIGK